MISFHEKGPAVISDSVDLLVIPPKAQDEFFEMCHENEIIYWASKGMWFKLDNVMLENAINIADAELIWPDFKNHRTKIEFNSMFCETIDPPSWA